MPRRASLLLAFALFAAPSGAARAQATLPAGFSDALVIGGLNNPVSMAFLPDGRLFLVEQQTARVRLVVNGTLSTPDPVVTVPNVQTSGGEQGLLGVAVDPGWPTRPYLYVQYDYSGAFRIHISRYTVAGDLQFLTDGSLTIDPASRYDILVDALDNVSNHNGGTLRFGPDGMLYSSLGDDASECPAQDLTVLVGKILRLDVSQIPPGGGGPAPKGLITPADNPFVANPDSNARLVAYSGLRNPFRFGIDPLTGAVAIGDVGEVDQEEIDYVTTLGANFEWPIREGLVAGPTTCGSVDMSRFTDPIHADDHIARQATIGGPVYRGVNGSSTSFGPEYDGDIFYSDYYLAYLRRLHGSGTSWAFATPVTGQPNATDWATGLLHVSDYQVSSNGSLWYCKQSNAGFQANTGEIRCIFFVSTAVAGPAIAGVTADPAPDGESCTIRWSTDEAADSRVAFGATSGGLDRESSDETLVFAHAVVLEDLEPGTTYAYRVTSAAGSAASTRPEPGAPALTFTTPGARPATRLLAPYPSPAAGSATIPFTLAAGARVTLALYDLRGHRVRTLIAGAPRDAGPQAERWDGRDESGLQVPVGVYFVRFEADGIRGTRRFALVR